MHAKKIFSWTLLVVASVATLGVVDTRLQARAAEREFPPLGETRVVEGLRQHFVDRGTGEPIVFVHGAYGGLQDFAATVVDELAERYRCVLWDRPGHGYSERGDAQMDPGDQARVLLRLLSELEIERPLLVGFSYGGAVCLAAALQRPAELRGVVLLNSPSHPWPQPLRFEYRLAGVPLAGWLASEVLVSPLSRWFGEAALERAFEPAPLPPSFAQSPLPLVLRPASYRANTDDIRGLKPFLRRQAERYRELAVPVTALVAEDDHVVSPTLHIPQLIEAAPLVHQVRLPGAGHQLLYTHPGEVLAAIDGVMTTE